MTIKERAVQVPLLLEQEYPDATCALHYQNDYELLFATRLSAQCTDARVNQVTPALFARFPRLEDYAAADSAKLSPSSSPAACFIPRPGISKPRLRCCWRNTTAKCPIPWSSYSACPASAGKRPI